MNAHFREGFAESRLRKLVEALELSFRQAQLNLGEDVMVRPLSLSQSQYLWLLLFVSYFTLSTRSFVYFLIVGFV